MNNDLKFRWIKHYFIRHMRRLKLESVWLLLNDIIIIINIIL